MNVREFFFELPPELIAQEPPEARGASRLLHLNRATGARTHSTIDRLAALLDPGDLLVANNTRVFPARLLGRRVPSGGAVECLLVRRLEGDRWEALMHPGHKLKPGAQVVFEDASTTIHGEVEGRHFYGRRTIRLWTEEGVSVDAAVDAIGHV